MGRVTKVCHGPPPPRPHHVPEAARHCGGPPVRAVRGQVRHLRLVRAPAHAGAALRRVRLWQLRGQVHHLRQPGRGGRLLLQGVCAAGKGRAYLGGGDGRAAAACPLSLRIRRSLHPSHAHTSSPTRYPAPCLWRRSGMAAPRCSTWARQRRMRTTSPRSTTQKRDSGGGWTPRRTCPFLQQRPHPSLACNCFPPLYFGAHWRNTRGAIWLNCFTFFLALLAINHHPLSGRAL